MTKIAEIALNDGHSIPPIGIGVWQIPEADVPAVITAATAQGCRLIDGAYIYGNEVGMGEGIRQSDVAREDLFVTSKVWNSEQGFDKTRRAIEGSLERIGVDYLDLMLIHWPCPSKDLYVETWKALIAAKEDGLVRSIGVSNFEAAHLDRLIEDTGVTPALNQIEVNPRMQQANMRSINEKRGIVTQSWTPLGGGASFDAPAIQAVCARTGKSPVQVILRWHLQLGVSVIPRTTKPERMATNLDLFDFEISDAEMQAIAALHEGVRCGPNPLEFEAE
jgi:2,5-diketo-D-gluconate reductase A